MASCSKNNVNKVLKERLKETIVNKNNKLIKASYTGRLLFIKNQSWNNNNNNNNNNNIEYK
jgi:hypothetical protein